MHCLNTKIGLEILWRQRFHQIKSFQIALECLSSVLTSAVAVGQLWLVHRVRVCESQCVQCLKCHLFDSSVCVLPSAAVGSAEALGPGTTGRAAASAAAAPAAAGQPAAAAAGAAAEASEVRGAGQVHLTALLGSDWMWCLSKRSSGAVVHPPWILARAGYVTDGLTIPAFPVLV